MLFDDNKPVFTVINVLSDRIEVSSCHMDSGRTVEHDRFEIKSKREQRDPPFSYRTD